ACDAGQPCCHAFAAVVVAVGNAPPALALALEYLRAASGHDGDLRRAATDAAGAARPVAVVSQSSLLVGTARRGAGHGAAGNSGRPAQGGTGARYRRGAAGAGAGVAGAVCRDAVVVCRGAAGVLYRVQPA